MFTLLQLVVDLIFALALILLTAAHFSHRSFQQEFDVFHKAMTKWAVKIEAKLDQGKITK